MPLPTHVGLNRNRTSACVRVLSGRETRTCHKEPIEFSIYPVYQLLTRHTEKRNTRGARKSSRLCAPWLRFTISWRRSVEEGKRVGQKGETSRKRSLDRLAFGRRNFETGSENRRKWLDFFHGRRIRGRVERQIEFGRSFCRSARFNSRRTSRWAWRDEEKRMRNFRGQTWEIRDTLPAFPPVPRDVL